MRLLDWCLVLSCWANKVLGLLCGIFPLRVIQVTASLARALRHYRYEDTLPAWLPARRGAQISGAEVAASRGASPDSATGGLP